VVVLPLDLRYEFVYACFVVLFPLLPYYFIFLLVHLNDAETFRCRLTLTASVLFLVTIRDEVLFFFSVGMLCEESQKSFQYSQAVKSNSQPIIFPRKIRERKPETPKSVSFPTRLPSPQFAYGRQDSIREEDNSRSWHVAGVRMTRPTSLKV
jgi:hypothetical protein